NATAPWNVRCETPTEALSSKVVARKVLAIVIAHTFQFLKVATIIRSSQRQQTARLGRTSTSPLRYKYSLVPCSQQWIIHTLDNDECGIEGVASEVTGDCLQTSGLKSPA